MTAPETQEVSTPAARVDAEAFERDGFVLVRGFLAPDEVARLRAICAERLVDQGRQEMLPHEFLEIPELTRVPFGTDTGEILRALLGPEVSVYPNLTVRKDLYVGWHIDEAFVGAGREVVWESEFAHVQGAVYLQDNDDETGGGLDVVPGSHTRSIDDHGTVTPDLRESIADLREEVGTRRLNSRAGDLVLWHARLVHASTPSATREPEDSEESKFGVFFSAGATDAYHQNRFLAHLVAKRVQREDGEPVVYERHAAVLDLRWPDDFPERVRDEVAASGLEVASLWS